MCPTIVPIILVLSGYPQATNRRWQKLRQAPGSDPSGECGVQGRWLLQGTSSPSIVTGPPRVPGQTRPTDRAGRRLPPFTIPNHANFRVGSDRFHLLRASSAIVESAHFLPAIVVSLAPALARPFAASPVSLSSRGVAPTFAGRDPVRRRMPRGCVPSGACRQLPTVDCPPGHQMPQAGKDVVMSCAAIWRGQDTLRIHADFQHPRSGTFKRAVHALAKVKVAVREVVEDQLKVAFGLNRELKIAGHAHDACRQSFRRVAHPSIALQ